MNNTLTIGETKTSFSKHSGYNGGGCNRATTVIHGLVCSYERTDSAWVDASIADLLVLLNRNGFKTNYSCSGLSEDHGGEIFPRSQGYIAFDKDYSELRELWKDLVRGQVFGAGSDTFNKMGIYLYESTKENWEELENRLIKYLENEAAKSRIS